MRSPDLIAHRGYPLHYPENTLPGIRAVLEAGARYVEIDVQLTSDHVPVVFHDATLERVCNAPGAVHDYELVDLSALRAGEPARFGNAFSDVEIPTLSAVVTLFHEWPGATLFAEVKQEALDRFGTEAVYWRIEASLDSIRGRAILISFNLDFMLAARKHGWPLLGAVMERWPERDHPLLSKIAPDYLFADVAGLPATGRLAWPGAKLAVYEITDPGLAMKLAARGVDLIETFEIGEMLAALNWQHDQARSI